MITRMNETPDTSTVLSTAQLNELRLDHGFWQFSLEKWQQPALQKALLLLQDTQGFQINHLLFAMWLGLERKLIGPQQSQIKLQTETWHRQVVSPLRSLRQSLPKHAIRTTVQKAELDAEQIEQALLFQLSASIPVSGSDSLTILIENLFASRLPKSHLLLFIQTCLPDYSTQEIQSQINVHCSKLSPN
jgi:uncharacterized protein (TIGR02444 family)